MDLKEDRYSTLWRFKLELNVLYNYIAPDSQIVFEENCCLFLSNLSLFTFIPDSSGVRSLHCWMILLKFRVCFINLVFRSLKYFVIPHLDNHELYVT